VGRETRARESCTSESQGKGTRARESQATATRRKGNPRLRELKFREPWEGKLAQERAAHQRAKGREHAQERAEGWEPAQQRNNLDLTSMLLSINARMNALDANCVCQLDVFVWLKLENSHDI
jgi:hypothetical protein